MSFYIKHNRVTFDCGTQSRTEQSHKDECDIHKILNQYKRTGVLNYISGHQAEYLDLPDAFDFQTSVNTVLDGQKAFATLPSSVRDRFSNDPAKFLAALGDPAFRPELEALGVLKKVEAAVAASTEKTPSEGV